jgi:hypothetical protein
MSQVFILPHGRPALMSYLLSLPESRKWRVTVAEYKANRSLEQNALFHSLVADIANFSGDTPERTKEAIKAQLGLQIVSKATGQSCPKPTHEYSVDEMSDLCTRVIAFCAEFQIPTSGRSV